MTKTLVLGAGRVGAVIAADLAAEADLDVTVADRSASALSGARARAGGSLAIRRADLSDAEAVRALAAEFDLVVGALPSRLGLAALRAVIEAGRPFADISFMPQDARGLDALARSRGVAAVVDIGVAPGMSHLLAAHGVRRLAGAQRVRILVGGVPLEPRPPFFFKAAFAPGDVVEEYTRPARLVEGGRVVERAALSIVEPVELPGVGRMEAGLTDGLRSLVHSLAVPEMVELTLRWPGHYGLIRALQSAGFFSTEPLSVGSAQLRPLDLTSALLAQQWTYSEGEQDLTVMRVEVCGSGRKLVWDLVDRYDSATQTTSMARTSGFPCAIVARLLADGTIAEPGVHPPEHLSSIPGLVQRVLAEHARRGVHYREEALEP